MSTGPSSEAVPTRSIDLNSISPDIQVPVLPEIPRADRYDMLTVLKGWERNTEALSALFSPAELTRVIEGQQLDRQGRIIFIATTQNPFGAFASGLCDIVGVLPTQFNALMKEDISTAQPDKMLRLSILHNNVKDRIEPEVLLQARTNATSCGEDLGKYATLAADEMPKDAWARVETPDGKLSYRVAFLGECQVPFGEATESSPRPEHVVSIYKVQQGGNGREWILYGSPDFFNADINCYNYSTDPSEDYKDPRPEQMIRDGLFSGAAVPYVLERLGLRENVIVDSQEWTFMTSALAIPEALIEGRLKSCSFVTTYHGIYDCNIEPRDIAKFSDRATQASWPTINGADRNSFYSFFSPLCAAPIGAVSSEIAQGCIENPKRVPNRHHIPGPIESFQGIGGITNGTYEPVVFSPELETALAMARQKNFQPLFDAKMEARSAFLAALPGILTSARAADAIDGGVRVIGSWKEETADGSPIRLSDTQTLFTTMGRSHAGQKGIDMLAQAIRKATDNGERYFIGVAGLTRDNDVNSSFVDLFQQVADECQGRVIFYTPWVKGDFRGHLQKAGSFAIVPSITEPTGLISQYSLNLTPCLVHAVDGLAKLVKHYNPGTNKGSGFLYGVEQSHYADEGWLKVKYGLAQERPEVPVYNLVVDKLATALEQVSHFYSSHPEHYARILANLPDMLAGTSWIPSIASRMAWHNVASGIVD